MSETALRDELRKTILELVEARGPESSICPSEAARACRDDWRALMPIVRDVAEELQQEDKILIPQQGEPVSVEESNGPIRLSTSME